MADWLASITSQVVELMEPHPQQQQQHQQQEQQLLGRKAAEGPTRARLSDSSAADSAHHSTSSHAPNATSGASVPSSSGGAPEASSALETGAAATSSSRPSASGAGSESTSSPRARASSSSGPSGSAWLSDHSESSPAKSTGVAAAAPTAAAPAVPTASAAAEAARSPLERHRPQHLVTVAGASSATGAPNGVPTAAAVAPLRLFGFSVTEGLADAIAATQACVYQPAEFFVAWQGVLTIVYAGIPPALCALKARLAEQFPLLPRENPGSLWPKTSLACLRDGKRLTPQQLHQLREICSKMNFQLVFSPPVTVDGLSVVLYNNCCLEHQIMASHVALRQPADPAPPSEEQRKYVRNVVDEFAARNLDKYWFDVSKDGNRTQHYRGSRIGCTIVHFLRNEVPPALAQFQRLVDSQLPGMYDWFEEDSLHITLRAVF